LKGKTIAQLEYTDHQFLQLCHSIKDKVEKIPLPSNREGVITFTDHEKMPDLTVMI
jgi:hypothetical protein